jgi:alanyl aminopeptidase
VAERRRIDRAQGRGGRRRQDGPGPRLRAAEGLRRNRIDPPLPAGPSTVRLEYAGKISRRDTGGIIKTQEAADWYITTHFEPIDARRAYPCFDEPSYKVPWELTLRVKKEHTAFSNAPIATREDGADGMTTVRFAPTKPLPSYLTAFTAGPFDRLENALAGKKFTPMGLLVPHGLDKQWAWYSVHDSPQILPRLEDYFGSPYPFEKLDMVSVPLGRGAMENPGLVTFASTILLIPRGEETVAFKRAATSVTMHEFAHLWFGDLVTTAWWDDIWLNEAFATWMTTKIIEPWRPEWKMDEQRVSVRNVAMAADALVTARRIREPIKSNDDMVNAFDAITYQKGASVIAMFERLVTAEKFQAGVRKYMKDHAYANATAKDFLSAISAEAGMDIEPAFSTFLDQSGVPLVTVQASCGGSPKVLLSQERYFPLGAEPSPEQRSQVWQIPVCARAGKERFCTVLATQKGEMPISRRPAPRESSRTTARRATTTPGGIRRSWRAAARPSRPSSGWPRSTTSERSRAPAAWSTRPSSASLRVSPRIRIAE